MNTLSVVMIPLAGTAIGSLMVFLVIKKINQKIEKALLGFAGGVMVAASIWSLIIPAIDMSSGYGKLSWLPAVVGLWAGIALLLITDKAADYLEKKSIVTLRGKGLSHTGMMLLAIVIHNIPEGMAVGVSCAGALQGDTGVTMAGAMALAVGIGIQNIPEGAIVSMPLYTAGLSKSKSFFYGVMSGIVEPIGAVLTILLAKLILPLLPYLLSLAAGAMLYVVAREIIPDINRGKHSLTGLLGAGLGFSTMMILDVALG